MPRRACQESHTGSDTGQALGQFSRGKQWNSYWEGNRKVHWLLLVLGRWGSQGLFTGTFAGCCHKPEYSSTRFCLKSVIGINSLCCCPWSSLCFFTCLALHEAGRSLILKLFQVDQGGLIPVFLHLSRYQNEFHADQRHQKPPCLLSMGCQGL